MTINWSKVEVQIVAELSGSHRYQRGLRIDPIMTPTTDDYDLWTIWAGQGSIRTRNGIVTLERGTCLWIGPGWSYDFEQDPDHPLGLSFIHFNLCSAGRRINPRARKNLSPDLLQVEDPQLVESVVRRTLAFCRARETSGITDPLEEQAATTIFKGLLMELTRPTCSVQTGGYDLLQNHNQVVTQLAAYIHDNIHKPLPVEHLAERAGYSRTYLTRIFKNITGLSLQAYIISARLVAARRMLAQSTLKISGIADLLGYQNVYFFSRQFKKHTGRTPSEFRNMRNRPVPDDHDTDIEDCARK